MGNDIQKFCHCVEPNKVTGEEKIVIIFKVIYHIEFKQEFIRRSLPIKEDKIL
jgi:hypothetical protein